ncbi:hypothetical protein G6O69_25785 [Pseudenhygromyxa sp. WMMC2535]|uniref:hypothetical protein n=1 Tax=Pseudenhygromyxa sp. WMMC2535 TaxID=2712867 RepID=UPI0015537BB7|nr:hypothetical protein [Pseudenhygromyxa sp. WMMC2535]NVB41277.1 hypothetical protein [Pseudenhygromyxa sp. WMMC2535]
MSPSQRASLAVGLAWAGGFGLPGGRVAGGLLLALFIILIIALLVTRPTPATPQPQAPRVGEVPPARALAWARALASALLLALLARSLGRTLIAAPSAWLSALVLAAAIATAVATAWLGHRRSPATAPPSTAPPSTAPPSPRWRGLTLAAAATALAIAAALLGARLEAQWPGARAFARSGPIIGVHPRQSVAVILDGYGPHDIVIDDYVDPRDGQGYDPEGWAAHLEAELHAIAERSYAQGPARAREAFGRAEVEVIAAQVAADERDAYPLARGVELRSGTTGAGASVRFVCPGQVFDPRASEPRASERALASPCPRKYVVDGSTGLGLSPRWPGYSEARGGDRFRLARLLGWPRGEARDDRRRLALESGLWMIALVALALALALAAPLACPSPLAASSPATSASASSAPARGPWLWLLIPPLLAAACLSSFALLALSPSPALAHGEHTGPTLLAIALTLWPHARAGDRAAWLHALPWSLALAAGIALLAASPLAGHGDALAALAQIREQLVSTLGLRWAQAQAVAAGLGVAALLPATIAAAAQLLGAFTPAAFREPQHGDQGAPKPLGALASAILGLTIAALLALRKPGGDLALLHGAAALLLAATLPHGWPRRRRAAAGALLAALALLAWQAAGDPLAAALLGLSAILALLTAVR